jgi:hypothetical protein
VAFTENACSAAAVFHASEVVGVVTVGVDADHGVRCRFDGVV